MRVYDIILKKRDGGELSKEEINFFVNGYSKGDVPDYQASALLMVIYFQGMSKAETKALTMAYMHSGDVIDLLSIQGIKVDKHSTGGVGDKTSIVLGPLVAAAGVPVAKLSGRGLGHTGGTIDKLESFKGFSVELSEEQFVKNVNEIGIAIAGQSANLVPADKKIYALRDVTATVDNTALVAASIMSKKLASGADKIVLDVKCGSGSFNKTIEEAERLAQTMMEIGEGLGKETVAIITDMEQPLGYTVGNAMEVIEAIDTLKGKGPEDLLEVCLTLGSEMLVLGGKATTKDEARTILMDLIGSGKALNKLKAFITTQGGDPSPIDDYSMFPHAPYTKPLVAETDGYIEKLDAETFGKASLLLGAGRETKESEIDLSAGILLHKKIGDSIKAGESIATLYAKWEKVLDESLLLLQSGIGTSAEPVKKRSVIISAV